MKKLAVVAVLMLGMSSVMAQKGGKPAPKVFYSIGYVYTDTLLSKMPSREDAMAKLKEFEANGYKELQEMEADYYKALNIYETGKATMTPFLIKMEEEKLQKKGAAIEERQQTIRAELQEYNQELFKPILARVKKAIETVADLKQLSYVIDETSTLYTKGGLNITNEVLVELLILDKASMKK